MAAAKGTQPPGGSRLGKPNKTTATLKEAILAAGEAVGADGSGKDGLTGYLTHVAKKDIKAFSSLLGRVLPLQLSNDDTGGLVINIKRFSGD